MSTSADLVLGSDSAFFVVDLIVEFAGSGNLPGQLSYAIENAAEMVADGYLDRDEFGGAVCALSIAIALRDDQPPPAILGIDGPTWSSLRKELPPADANRLLQSMASKARSVLVASQEVARADVPIGWRDVSVELAASLGLKLPAPPPPADVIRRLSSQIEHYYMMSVTSRGARVSLAGEDGHEIAGVVIIKPVYLSGNLSGSVSRTELRERDAEVELVCWGDDGEGTALTVRGAAVVVEEQ